MEFKKFIIDKGFVLIPVVYIIGNILKGMKKIPDKYIPIVLLFVSIGMSLGLLGLSVSSILQGVLIVGVTVYSNQIVKQISKIK